MHSFPVQLSADRWVVARPRRTIHSGVGALPYSSHPLLLDDAPPPTMPPSSPPDPAYAPPGACTARPAAHPARRVS